MIKVVIIEDEEILAKNLAKKLREFRADIDIVKVIESVEEGVTYLQENDEPDLYFADVQLSDGLSFEIFSRAESKKPIVFCTAFDAYTFDAFRFLGIEYILKPYDDESIERALDKYEDLIGWSADLEKDLADFKAGTQPDLNSVRKLLVNKGESIIPISFDDVALVYKDESGLHLITIEQQKFHIDGKLEYYESLLGGNFFRVNRQFIVSRESIAKVNRLHSRKLSVHLSFEFNVPIYVSRVRISRFLTWLSN